MHLLHLPLALAGLLSLCSGESSEECEQRGKRTCLTGFPQGQLRSLLNAAIEANEAVRAELVGDLRASEAEVDQIRAASEPAHQRRLRRSAGSDVRPYNVEERDCHSVCCARVNHSEPMSQLRVKDGWEHVLSTPEYPQRTVFRQESCVGESERCRDVQSTKRGFIPRCRTAIRRHRIFFYEIGADGTPRIHERDIEIPTACRCQLWSVKDGVGRQSPQRHHHDRRRRSSAAKEMLRVFHSISRADGDSSRGEPVEEETGREAESLQGWWMESPRPPPPSEEE